jgi:zincin-like metallopeptidase
MALVAVMPKRAERDFNSPQSRRRRILKQAAKGIGGECEPSSMCHCGKLISSKPASRVRGSSRRITTMTAALSRSANIIVINRRVRPSAASKRASILEAAPFGSPTYSVEELVAEMGAAYLCAESGISPAVIENQAAYVSGWLKKLRDDRKLVVRAAAHAQHAADYVLGKVPTAV